MNGSEGYDFLMRYYPDARRNWTPAQRVWIIAAWDALPCPEKEKPAWFLLPSGQNEPNELDLIEAGKGSEVLNDAVAGHWL